MMRIDLTPVIHRSCRRSLVAAIVAVGCIVGPSLAVSPSKSSPILKVFGTDDRQAVGDTTQFPWSTIGSVQATWRVGGQIIASAGTGTLVGNYVVLTGGHVVYDQVHGWADAIVFIPGLNGLQEPFGRGQVVRTISQSGWVESDDNRYDLALLVLDRPMGQQAGYMEIAAEPESFFVDRNLNTTGYPGETKPGDIQYHAAGTSMDVQGGLIRHTLDSEPGQSGSPIWYYQADQQSRKVVGVLTGSRQFTANGQTVDAYNVGVRIDSVFAQWINDALVKYDTVTQDTAMESADIPQAAPVCGSGAPAAMVMALVLMSAVRFTTAARRKREREVARRIEA